MPKQRSRALSRLSQLSVAVTIFMMATGCVRIPSDDDKHVESQPTFQPQITWGRQPMPPFDSIPPRNTPCTDKDKAVIATCIKTAGTVFPVKEDTVFVGEKETGSIVQYTKQQRTRVIAHVHVDTSHGGGLLDWSPAPQYAENRLIYALITTPHDIRLVRIADSNSVKPIFTGIPRSKKHADSAAIVFIGEKLYLIVGKDDSSPSSGRYAGSLFYLDDLSSTHVHKTPHFISHEFTGNLDMCPAPDGKTMYITSHTSQVDKLFSLPLDSSTASLHKVWTWNSPVGVRGCVIPYKKKMIAIGMDEGKGVLVLKFDKNNVIHEQPKKLIEKKYGRINRLSTDPHGTIYLSTINSHKYDAKTTDDRVVRVQIQTSGGSGSKV